MQNTQYEPKKIDLVIVFLVLFTSVGWIVDSGTMQIKLMFFLLLAVACLTRIVKFGCFRLNTSLLWLASPVLSMIVISLVVHGRIEDLILVLKLLLALLIVFTIPNNIFWKAIPELLRIMLPFIIGGYILQLIGVYYEIPSFLLSQDSRKYSITPLLTVIRENEINRAFGFFWEPAVLALVANLSLISKVFICKSKKSNSYWVEFLVVFISQSAGGFLSTILILSSTLINQKNYQSVIVITFFIIFSWSLSLDFETMRLYAANLGNIVTVSFLNRDLLNDGSFSARIIDMYAPFLLGLENLFGSTNIENFILFSSKIRGHSADIITNTFGFIAYMYGFPIMLAYLAALSYSVVNIANNKNYLLIIIFVFLLFSNPLSTVLLVFVLMLSPSQTARMVKVKFN